MFYYDVFCFKFSKNHKCHDCQIKTFFEPTVELKVISFRNYLQTAKNKLYVKIINIDHCFNLRDSIKIHIPKVLLIGTSKDTDIFSNQYFQSNINSSQFIIPPQ